VPATRTPDRLTRIAVVGASGFVGATLVERLLARGQYTVVPLIHSTGSAWRLSRHALDLRTVELLSPEALRTALRGCTHVVNCSSGPREVMLRGLENLLGASLAEGVQRFVHLSSVAVYGDPPPPEAVHEDAPTRPVRDTYGWNKLRQDQLVQAAYRRGLPSVILCPPYIGGAYSMFVLRVLQAIQEGRLALVDGGDAVINLVDVQNLAQAIELALSCATADAQRLFVNDDAGTTWRQFTSPLVDLAGRPKPLPSISRDEASGWLGSVKTAPSTLGRRMKRLIASHQVRTILQEDPLITKLFQLTRSGIRFLPGSARERLDGILRPPKRRRPRAVHPAFDERLCRLQLRGLRHACDRAREVLGYRPEVSFAGSMEAFQAWYRTTNGWGAEYAPLFEELLRTPAAPKGGDAAEM